MKIKDKIKKLAFVGQKISEIWKNLKLRIHNLGKKIYSSKFFLVLRGVGRKLRRFRAFAWTESKIRKYKIQLWYVVAMLVFIGIALFIFQRDLSKDYGYDPVEEVSYEDVDWKGKYDNDGFTYSPQGDFKYKIVITPPNKSFLFKPSTDIAEVKMFIKDLRGSIQIPKGVTVIDQEGRSSKSRTIWTLSNQKKLTLISQAHFTSLLGLSFISPNQGVTITVNGQPFNHATIQVPADSTIIKYGDQFSANSYKIDDHNVFFHSFSNPAVVYYQKGFHRNVQIVLFIILFISIIIVLFFSKIRIKQIQFKNKHFIIIFLIITILMYLLSVISPNPKNLAIVWDETTRGINKTEQFNVYPTRWINKYLTWVLYLNQTVDAVVVGDVNGGCSGGLLRIGRYGINKIIVLEEYRNSQCAQDVLNSYPQKVSIIPQSEASNALSEIKTRDYRYNKFTFKYTAPIIFLLSNVLLGLACAFLIWKAINIKRLRDIAFFIVYSFSSYYILIMIYATVGWVAHIPIGYHGSNTLGLIMSNYFLPGTISGGNNLRNFFAFLGVIVILITSRSVFRRLNMQVYFIVMALLCLLLLIPNSEYHTNRFLLSGFSAEAYIWDYKQDIINSLDMYKSIREADVIDYYKRVSDPVTYGMKDITHAVSLKSENLWQIAQIELENIISQYKENEEIVSRAHYELATLYFQTASGKGSANFSNSLIDNNSYYHLALEEYLLIINIYPEKSFVPEAMNNIAQIYVALDENDKAIKTYMTILELFPNSAFENTIRQKLANLYIEEGRNNEAINIFKEIIQNNTTTDINKAKLDLAQAYISTNNNSKASEELKNIINDNINNPAILIRSFTSLEKTYSAEYKNDFLLIKRALDIETIGNPRSSLMEYLNIEQSIIDPFNKVFVKSKIVTNLQNNFGSNLQENADYQELTNYINGKIADITTFDVNSKIKDKYLTDNQSGVSKNIDVFINDEFSFYENDQAEAELTPIESITLDVKKPKSNCGNDICEIGESQSVCSVDCHDSQKPEIKIRASAATSGTNNWPYILLSINDQKMIQIKVNATISSDFTIPVEFVGPEKDYKIKIENVGIGSLILEQIAVNNEVIIINKYLNSSKSTALYSVTSTTKPVEETKGQFQAYYENFVAFLDKYATKISPIEYNSFLNSRFPSRGMTLYFTAIVCLLVITFYSRTFRTFTITIIILFLSRGILRVAEQDPFRAWVSMDSGVQLGVKFSLFLIILNAVIYTLVRVLKYSIIYIKKVRDHHHH